MTDHKAEAEGWLHYAEQNQSGPDVSLYLAQMATAQATLYAAEQQRTANLIAWISLPSVVTDDVPEPFNKARAADVVQRNEIRRTIREGLGLS